ncbi:coiled-coil domain-containing protein 34 isoform X2 [Varanus komodoensis]|uniref:coiled-coil domain-containing protein 34 isoform X2 n=1 Tax=Varanus komodoensis TaxID=61221 RepID=UPI001CF768F7|nr:coiled-coil domain-containing protein 34 isoform X2 [Varanus komodoensis]
MLRSWSICSDGSGRIVEVPVTMPTSVPPRSRRGAAHSTPSSPVSSDDEGAGKSSTFSLISPSFHQSFSDFHRKEQEEEATPANGGSAIPQRIKHHSGEHFDGTQKKNKSPMEDNLSAWEEWFLCKEKELRARLQARALEELNIEMEKKKEKQEREKKKLIAEEKHKEWVQKKNEEEKREKERKLSKEMAEKTAKELERAQSKEKAKEMYEEWLKKKKMEDVQKKKKEKEKERQKEAELQEKKEKSERMFKEWLQNSRTKIRPASADYVYANGKLTGYPDGNAYPAPAFYNPIPWKPIHAPHPKEEKYVSVKKNKRPISSNTYRPSVLFHKSKNNLYIGPLCRIQR